jgi:hypothetical protein
MRAAPVLATLAWGLTRFGDSAEVCEWGI